MHDAGIPDTADIGPWFTVTDAFDLASGRACGASLAGHRRTRPGHTRGIGCSTPFRAAEGTHITPSIRLHATPGHTPQDITTLVGTADDVVDLTHLWWTEEGPADDPDSLDREELRQQRKRVLDLATLIVPGHGAPFRPECSTPL